MTRNPQLKEKILTHVEASYQHILARETATLRLTRKLADGNCRTASVNINAGQRGDCRQQAASGDQQKCGRGTEEKKTGYISELSILLRA